MNNFEYFKMNKMLGLLLILVMPAWAGLYPIAIPYKTEPADQYLRAYFFTTVTDIGSASEQVLPPGYVVTMFAREGNNGEYANDFAGAAKLQTDGVRTLGDLVMQAYNSSSNEFKNGSLTFYYSPKTCFAWGAVPGYVNQPDIVGAWSSFISPVPCLQIPPVSNLCKFTSNDILLDHGTLTDSEGDIATAQASVQCSAETDVKFLLATGGKYIHLDEGMSEITVNKLPLESKITLPQGGGTIEIEDKLSGVVTSGAHSGSSVLIMSVY